MEIEGDEQGGPRAQDQETRLRQGATFVKGGHSSGVGIERDCEKACLAAIYGWRYLPVTKHMIQDGRAVALIAQALGVRTDD